MGMVLDEVVSRPCPHHLGFYRDEGMHNLYIETIPDADAADTAVLISWGVY